MLIFISWIVMKTPKLFSVIIWFSFSLIKLFKMPPLLVELGHEYWELLFNFILVFSFSPWTSFFPWKAWNSPSESFPLFLLSWWAWPSLIYFCIKLPSSSTTYTSFFELWTPFWYCKFLQSLNIIP